jgi:thiol:disulfide interchange protein
VNTRPWIALLSVSALLCVPVLGNGWQSGRLKNQKSTPHASDTVDSGSDPTLPTLVRPGEPDTARPDRAYDERYNKISWERSLRSALKTASNENKAIVVDVYADWCGWCKRMDKTVYSDPRVAALGSEVVFLKLNAEDRGEGQQFARQNGVHGFPTTIILDRRGSVLNKTTGYIGSPDQFIRLVERSKSGR